MNILVIASSKGTINALRPEAETFIDLAKQGFHITIATQKNEEYPKLYKQNNIDVVNVNLKNKISFDDIVQLRKTIKQKNIDLVYATNSKSISNAIFACIFLPVKLIVYRGTTGGLYKHDPSAYLNALNPRVDGVICVSDAVKTHVKKQLFPFQKKYINRIYKGHNLTWYDYPKADLTQLGSSEKKFNIVFVGNIRPHKGLFYLLAAAKKIALFNNIHIILVGDKITDEQYLNMIAESGMQDRIHIAGFRNDAPSIIKASDILVHTSYRKEGLPRVILESLALNTPVIATNNSSNCEIIEDGINGHIIPQKDPEALAEKIIQLYQNRSDLKYLSQNTQNILRNTFSHYTTVTEFENFFKNICRDTDSK